MTPLFSFFKVYHVVMVSLILCLSVASPAMAKQPNTLHPSNVNPESCYNVDEFVFPSELGNSLDVESSSKSSKQHRKFKSKTLHRRHIELAQDALVSTIALVSPNNDNLYANDKVSVIVKVKNQLKRDVYFLKWGTPFSPFRENTFQCTRSSTFQSPISVEFLGLQVKTAPPTEKDFILLKAGQTREVKVNIRDLYDLSKPGKYEIQLSATSNIIIGSSSELQGYIDSVKGSFFSSPEAVSSFVVGLDSTSLKFEIKSTKNSGAGFMGITHRGPSRDSRARGGRRVEFESDEEGDKWEEQMMTRTTSKTVGDFSLTFGPTCFDDHIDSLTSAVEHFSDLMDSLQLPIFEEKKCGKVFRTFFGSADRHVYQNYAILKKGILAMGREKNIRFECDKGFACTSSTIAYIQPALQSNIINVCKAFFALPIYGGFNNQAGTLVHELSHFPRVAGTKDLRYGPALCETIALKDPRKAIMNADNWEFYAESMYHNTLKVKGAPFPTQEPLESASSSKPKASKSSPSKTKTAKYLRQINPPGPKAKPTKRRGRKLLNRVFSSPDAKNNMMEIV